MVAADTASGKYQGRVATRFPPEPNGFLHIGHAKSICLNFGIAEDHEGGRCHLRFDDTNPTKEDTRYVEAIQSDLRWLGFDWGEHLYYASDYFERFFAYGEDLIRAGLAFVDSSSEDEIHQARGNVIEPGRNSPFRDRSPEENLDLLRRMRAGEFPTGAHVLRAKIDMAHPNPVMRDPLLIRILHEDHYRQGDNWCIYPLYDFAHCLGDSIEGVTHSLCSLEFENNRAIYNWLLDNLDVPRPQPEQTEFARLNIDYTILSKRSLLALVDEGHVDGWDDPRMPTLAGLRRRGVTPEAIRRFCDMVGVTRADSRVDPGKLEYAIRDDLNHRAPRVLAVLDPLKVVITNFPEGTSERVIAANFPKDAVEMGAEAGERELSFSGVVYIERSDFAENPPAKFRRLVQGKEVRLKYAFVIRCNEVIKDPASGEIVELRCTYDPETRGGDTPDGRRVPGTIHWVDHASSLPATVRLYDQLFSVADPGAEEDFREHLNPESVMVMSDARVEAGVASDTAGTRYQFERLGYFVSDETSRTDALVFNRTVALRDSWAKESDDAGARDETKKANPKEASYGPSDREGLSSEQAEDLVELEALGITEQLAVPLARSGDLLDLFHGARSSVGALGDKAPTSTSLAKWLVNDVARELAEAARNKKRGEAELGRWAELSPEAFAALIGYVDADEAGHRGAKDALRHLIAEGGSAEEALSATVNEEIGDETLIPIVDGVLAQFPDRVAAYKDGKKGLAGFFVGQIMRASQGTADPKRVSQLLAERLGR